MATSLRYPKGYQFFDSNGNTLALGQLFYYVAGTTTPQDTYSDSAGTVPNTNPIVLDGSGRLLVDVYLGSSSNYKEVLMTSSVTLSPWPDDNIQRAVTVFTGDSGSGGTAGLVPAPAAGSAAANQFLSASGAWVTPPNAAVSVNLATTAATASGAVLTFASVPTSITAGMVATDTTHSTVIQAGTTVLSTTSTTVTLSASVTGSGVASGDTINFNGAASAVTNLSVTETATTVSIAASSGAGATIPAATDTTAGVLDSARAAKIDGLATVATSGSYNDLSNKPAIPAAQVNSDWNASSGVAQILNKPASMTPTAHASTHAAAGSDPISISASQVAGLAAVATSGAYSSLSGTPAIPSASSSTPNMDGTASAGASANYARADHTHPADTSRAPLASPALTGTPTAPTPSAGDNSTKLATTAYLDAKLGANSGIATLDAGGHLTAAQIPASLVGAVVYQGTWNASTNSPALASGVGTKGYYYKVGTAGTAAIDGNSQWNVGDTIIFDGTAWDKIDGITNEVVTVAGLYGNIASTALKSALAIGASDVSGLATVATTGAYSSLSGTPAIPAAQVNSDWNASSGVAQILNKPASMTPTAHASTHAAAGSDPIAISASQVSGLAAVATSGAYSSLSGAPSLGTAAALNVPSSGNATSGQVVTGADTRLTWTDNFSVSAQLLANGGFTSDLSSWGVSGWTWSASGATCTTAGGTLSQSTGQTYAANTIYHVQVNLASNTGGGSLNINLMNGGTAVAGAKLYGGSGTGVLDYYFMSPGPTAGTETLRFWSNADAVTIQSVSWYRITFTQKALTGGLNLLQGGQINLQAGSLTNPAITFFDPNAPATQQAGIYWSDVDQAFDLVINGTKTIGFNCDLNGAYNQINGNGSNRLTINNPAALVLQPMSGHMEFEGSNNYLNTLNSSFNTDFEIVGYVPGSSIGHGIRIRGEATTGNQPQYLFGVMSGQAPSDTLPGIIVIDHTGTQNGVWYPNGNLQVQALTANNVVYKNASVNLTAGYTATADAIGTPASGAAVTPVQANGDYHTIANNAAFTLAVPTLTAPANCASGVIEVTNGASAGTITLSGWTKVAGSFDTTSGHKFQCDYCITPNGSYLNIRAMQ